MTTETLPAVRPLEPTTPIKPSEAIRLGCLIAPKPQTATWGTGQRACVNRALVLGLLGSDDDQYHAYDFVDEQVGKVALPSCGADCIENHGWSPSTSEILLHLNDDHRWSRERIADWLAGQGL